MQKPSLSLLAAIMLAAAPARAAAPAPSADEAEFRAIYKEMVETDSSGATGDCTVLVNKVAARMKAAGFPAGDIQIIVPPEDPKAGNLVAVVRGRDPSAKAVLLLGHIDVVNADRADWTRDPFTLIEENGEFYGRGVSDMKAQDAVWVEAMLRFQKAPPRRTVKMALTCGEEGGGRVNGAGWIVANKKALIDAGIAITEGGGGELDDDGRRLAVTVMGAEKDAANFTIELTGPGGHSSKPRPDNLITRVGAAMVRLDQTDFPIGLNAFNRSYFSGIAPRIGGERGEAMKRLLANPQDAQAAALLKRTPAWRAMLTTTCIPTLIEGGHASNAQPQRVKVTLNCRLLPPGDMDLLKAQVTKAIAEPQAKIDMLVYNADARVPSAPLTEAVMEPVRKAAAEVFPGVPVVAMQETFGTDSAKLIVAGIPTYGISGMFRGFDSGNIHGLNEHISVRSVMDGRAFLHRLVKSFAEQ
jgi:acetylornithine deacetylase/succinyl-diaminopimelate desuccinylase-like protein